MSAKPPRIVHEGDRLRGHTERRLMVGGFAILALLGGGLLWLWYGSTTATIAVAIVLGGAGIVALLWLLLSLAEAWARGE